MRNPGFVLALALGLAAAPALGAELKLTDYVGVWKGSGTYERITSSRSEGILTCKLTITAQSETAITVDGRCAAPEGSQSFSTRITATNGRLSGVDGKSGRASSGTLGASGFALSGKDAEGETYFALSSPLAGPIRMDSSDKGTRESRSAIATLKR